jgi:nucleoside-diphosphate-sugar epimerase
VAQASLPVCQYLNILPQKKTDISTVSNINPAHTLEQLLEKDYTIVTTVRSEDKANKIRSAFPEKVKDGKLEIVIVPDIAKPDAFDEVAKTPGLDAVVHVASPFHFNISEFTRPRLCAIQG